MTPSTSAGRQGKAWKGDAITCGLVGGDAMGQRGGDAGGSTAPRGGDAGAGEGDVIGLRREGRGTGAPGAAGR